MLFKTRRLIIAGLAYGTFSMPLLADQAEELKTLIETSDEFSREQYKHTQQVKEHIEGSKRLRQLSDEDISSLINQICGYDIEIDDTEGTSLAISMTDNTARDFGDVFEPLEESAVNLLHEIEQFVSDMQGAVVSFRSLADSNDPNIKDKAKPILDDINKNIEASSKRYKEVEADLQTTKNVAGAVMKGSNNPRVRAAMEYGKKKHMDMQSSLRCDDKEVVLPNGRADCVKFDMNNCMVIEIKPDSADRSKAEDQVSKYAEELKTYYSGNVSNSTLAKERCKKDSDGHLLFEKHIETYTACKSSSF